jgi:hypothetical protein
MTTLAQVRSDAVSVKTQELRYERHDAAEDRHLDPVVMLHLWCGCTRFLDHTVAALPDRERFVVDLYSLGAKPGWRNSRGRLACLALSKRSPMRWALNGSA